jgi:hypothetical protein
MTGIIEEVSLDFECRVSVNMTPQAFYFNVSLLNVSFPNWIPLGAYGVTWNETSILSIDVSDYYTTWADVGNLKFAINFTTNCIFSALYLYSAHLTITYAVPQFGMKTKEDGYFYQPTASYSYIKIEKSFTNHSAVCDQRGAIVDGYSFQFPDGTVDMKDISFEASKYGTTEGQTGWDYMSDIIPSRDCDMSDVGHAASHNGNAGSWYSASKTNLWIAFKHDSSILYQAADSDGFVPYCDCDNMTVYYHPDANTWAARGALLSFWT